MKTSNRTFQMAQVAAAVLLACGSAQAQVNDEVREAIKPESIMSIGAGGVNNVRDAKRFGQYTGMNQQGMLLLDFDINKRDDGTGVWTTLTGRNLGLESREFNVTTSKQGDWRYAVDYNEMVRYDPYVITTGMIGMGTANPVIQLINRPVGITGAWASGNNYVADDPSRPAGHEEELKLRRTAIGLSGDKWINAELQFEVNFRNEDKKGARMFGRSGLPSSDSKYFLNSNGASGGTAYTSGATGGGGAMLLMPEAIDSNIRSIEAKLNFNRGDLAISGGYYGSYYTNRVGSMNPTVPGSLNRGALWATGTDCVGDTGACNVQTLASSAAAVPPDNQAHQVYVSGTYKLTPDTRANFKMSYTHASQDEGFVSTGLSPSSTAPASLGGVVDTTLIQAGLSSRATKELTINSSLRYEDRVDRTPVYVYNYGSTSQAALNGTTNWGSGSQTRTTAKVDGIYRLPDGYSALVGADFERKATPLPPANSAIVNGQVYFRPSTDESGVHAALRKAMAEDLNGSVGIDYKQRRGGDGSWFTTTGTAGNALLNVSPATLNKVFPDLYMDRDRQRVRASLDWAASEQFSLQTVIEHGHDFYFRDSPVVSGAYGEVAGARIISNDSFTLDGSYKVSDDWRVNAYWTHSENRWKVNKASLADDTSNVSETVGLSLRGKVTSLFTLGGDLLALNDVAKFNNMPATGNIAGFGSTPGNFLPDIHYNNTRVNLFGLYSLDTQSAIRVNYVVQEFRSDDWQWGYNGVPFVYSDNTTVSSNLNQSMSFLGVTYIYKFN